MTVKTINGTRKVQNTLFEIPIITAERIEKVVCHSVPDPLTSEGSPVDLSMLRKCFPTYKNIEKLQRDTRPAEILLGIDVIKLHPQRKICSNDNLSLMRGPLGDTLIGCPDSGSFSTVSSYYICKEKDNTCTVLSKWHKWSEGLSGRCFAC